MSREPTRAEVGRAPPLTPPEIRLACLRAAIELRSGVSTPESIMATAEAFFAFTRRPWNERQAPAMQAGDLGIQQ